MGAGESVVFQGTGQKIYTADRIHHAGDAGRCRSLSQNELSQGDCPKVTGGRPQREADHSQGMVKGVRDDSQALTDKNWPWVTMDRTCLACMRPKFNIQK